MKNISSSANKYFWGMTLMFLILMQSTGCSKFLDKKNDDRLTVPKTLDDLQALLDDINVMNIRTTPALGEASSDDYFINQGTYDMLATNNQLIYKWQLREYGFQNDWSKCYYPIYNANYCIETIEDIPRTTQNEVKWNNVVGSAYFFRAYYYQNLVWVFAKAYDENTADQDLGIVLRFGSDFNVPSNRASVKETYDQIISDARQATFYLDVHPQHKLRPSKAAAYGLLARTYLSMRMYDSALHYADLCLGIKNDLINFGTEITSPGSSFPMPINFTNKETIFYAEMSTLVSIHIPQRAFVDTSLFLLYDANDKRRAAWFRANSGFQKYKGSYTRSNQSFTGIATDEIYLIRAECYARTGDVSLAMDDLNTLLVNRWMNNGTWAPFEASTPEEALEIILIERRKELIYRGIRWMDIKRLNKENVNISQTRDIGGQVFILQPNANYYALPLPDDVIKLTGMPQNPN